MNFFDKFFLRVFLLPASLYKRYGVNLEQLQAILTAKLTMDNRRPSGFQQMKTTQQKEKKELKRATLGAMLGALLMGLMFLFSFAFGKDVATQLLVFYSMFIVMLALTLITDFTSVLIDVRDTYIIQPKPITDATFVSARLLHICIHISKTVLPMTLPAFILLMVIHGWQYGIPFIIMTAFATLFAIFLINAVYILILKITTPAKFQSIISYIQIAFAIIIYGAYQLLPRLMDHMDENLSLANVRYIRLIPTFWFAESVQSLGSLSMGIPQLISLVCAIFIPLFCTILVVKYFAPSFNRKLSMITSSVAESNVKTVQKEGKAIVKGKLFEKIGRLITKSNVELSGYLFTWKMMLRSREFKLKVYPAIGYLIVIVVVFILRPGAKRPDEINLAGEHTKTLFIMALYVCSFILYTAVRQLQFSEKAKAAWVFYISPLKQPGEIMSGAIKATMVQFLLPIILLVSGGAFIFFGIKILPNLLFALFNIVAMALIYSYMVFRNLPFSISTEQQSKGATFINNMLSTLIPVSIGFVHYFLFNFQWLITALIILPAIVIWLMFDSIKKISWERLGGSAFAD